MLWPKPSPKDFLKTSEDPNSSIKTTECSINNLSRRLSTIGCHTAGDTYGKRYLDLCPSTSRVHSKFPKISARPFSNNRISGNQCRLNQNEIKSAKRENGGNNLSMRESFVYTKCDNKVFDEVNRTPVFISNCSSFSTSSIQSSSETANPGVIQSQNYDSSIVLTEEVRGELDWWCQNLHLSNGRSLIATIPQLVISSDASTQGWGAYCKGLETVGQWLAQEMELHTNILELKAAKLAIVSFHGKFPTAMSIHIQMDNIVVPTYLKKMGGTRCLILTAMSKEIWKYLLAHQITITVEYLPGILNVRADWQSRNVKDSSEWMLNTAVFRALCKVRGTPCTDLFTSRLSHQVPVYFSWKIDPYSRGQDATLDSCTRVCFASILSDRESFMEGPNRPCIDLIDNTSLANLGRVSSASSLINQEPNPSPSDLQFIAKPTRSNPPISSEQNSAASGLDCFRNRIKETGISEEAVKLITAARRQGTIKHYQSAWNKWSGWCSGKQIDPFRCSIDNVINFLTCTFNENKEYNTIAGYRSAISAYHDPINGVSVGRHLLVSDLLTGILNKRFPQPRYTFIWDVGTVISYLSSIQSKDIKPLTLKLTMLLALTSAARAHEIAYLDIRYLVRHHSGYSFHFCKPTKTAKKGKLRPPLIFSHFEDDTSLCVCHHIDLYLSCTTVPLRDQY